MTVYTGPNGEYITQSLWNWLISELDNALSTSTYGRNSDGTFGENGGFGSGGENSFGTRGGFSGEGYEEYVDSLPATGVSSDGGLIIEVPYSGFTLNTRWCNCDGDTHRNSLLPTNSNQQTYVSYSEVGNCITHSLTSSGNSYLNNRGHAFFVARATFAKISFSPSIFGSYSVVSPKKCLINSSYVDVVCDTGSSWVLSSSGTYNRDFNIVEDFNLPSPATSVAVTFEPCRLKVIPSSSSDSVDVTSSDSHDTYNTNTRTGSITGDYGIIGDNNTVTVYEDTTIVNEGDKILTIPGAGDGGGNLVIPFTGWSYDYNDRSYELDLSSNEYTGAKVTFDDAKLQIDLSYTDSSTGDTITNTYDIKYVIETTVQETPTPTETPVVTPTPTPVVTDTPTPTTTVQPTATPSTETEPDGSIHVIVENPYPVYPAEGLEVPEGWIGLRDKLLGFFRELPEMFGQLIDFLRSGFDYIPSDIITLITFAIAMAVLVGLFKMFWR